MLANSEKNKWVRQITLAGIGLTGQTKIRQAKVAVVGCGGLGCPVLLYLAASGVGTLGLIDFDTVTISNLHRQILYGNNDVGQLKTDVAAKKLQVLHPEVNYNSHTEMINNDNVAAILEPYDVVVDGSDNFMTRYVVNDACVRLKKPLVYASILGYEGQLAVFNYANTKNLRSIFPEPPAEEDVPSCAENGVMPPIPGIMGSMLAHECLKVILEQAAPSGHYHVFDFMHQTHRVLNF
jgi:adenylyltransferase/sulfurtransferase